MDLRLDQDGSMSLEKETIDEMYLFFHCLLLVHGCLVCSVWIGMWRASCISHSASMNTNVVISLQTAAVA